MIPPFKACPQVRAGTITPGLVWHLEFRDIGPGRASWGAGPLRRLPLEGILVTGILMHLGWTYGRGPDDIEYDLQADRWLIADDRRSAEIMLYLASNGMFYGTVYAKALGYVEGSMPPPLEFPPVPRAVSFAEARHQLSFAVADLGRAMMDAGVVRFVVIVWALIVFAALAWMLAR